MRNWSAIFALTATTLFCNAQEKSYTIPTAGNSFEIDYKTEQTTVLKDGIFISPNTKNKTSVYFKLQDTGSIKIRLKGETKQSGKMLVKFGKLNKKIKFNSAQTLYNLGETTISKAGYYHLDLTGMEGEITVSDLILEGTATSKGVIYSNDALYYYWSKRGPSCHLKYEIPTQNNVTYYYSEITVPKGQDVQGSYYMANGFKEGYFGIQVNGPTERRILFSVWSPFHTDNPNEIPEEEQIKLLKKGKDVHVGEFGNEGSGGQSYLRYNWKADTSYKFLLKGIPDGNNNTDYTAWFFVAEQNNWQLIASFKRPKTNTYLKGFHSFLENFNPNQGHLTRSANYTNQWVYDGTWKKINAATFTVDATYQANQRVDAIGGLADHGYFLKMGGFFNDYVKPKSTFNFNNLNGAPEINFDQLP